MDNTTEAKPPSEQYVGMDQWLEYTDNVRSDGTTICHCAFGGSGNLMDMIFVVVVTSLSLCSWMFIIEREGRS